MNTKKATKKAPSKKTATPKKTTKKTGKKMGRPKIIIDYKKLGMLLEAGANGTSIADMMGVNEKSLYRRVKIDTKMTFEEYKRQKREKGLDSLRVKQYEVAIKGNVSMLIWLGKQYLGQKETIDPKQKDYGQIMNWIDSQKVDK